MRCRTGDLGLYVSLETRKSGPFIDEQGTIGRVSAGAAAGHVIKN